MFWPTRAGVRPWSWTGSRGGFDPLPRLVILELRGAQVAERGVQPASVVDLVNEAGKIRGDVLECFVVHQVDGFDLQRPDEAFGLGVVVGVSTPAHRADEPMLCEQPAVSLAGILRTSIRVMDTALGGCRARIAAFSAAIGRRASIERLIAYPTTRRDQAS